MFYKRPYGQQKESAMRMALLATAFALVAATSSAYANGEHQQPAEQPAPQQQTTCGDQPCMRTVTTKKIVGYTEKVVRIPRYKVATKQVPCGDDCAPKQVQTEGVDIKSPKPKVVHVEQEIVVVTKPKVVYAPVPPVQVAAPRPVVYQQPQMVHVAPPPHPMIVRANPCPSPCPPPAMSMCGGQRGCPPPGYGAPAAFYGGQQQRISAPMQQVASHTPIPQTQGWTNHGKNDVCVGKPKNSPFECTSPTTGRQVTCYCD